MATISSTPQHSLRPVVLDTSPLNYLIRLGCVDILRDMHGKVLVPGAVLAELSHPAAPSEVRAWLKAPPLWIEFVRVSEIDLTLPKQLGAGEREAVSLAATKPDSLLIVDDQRARSAAMQRFIETTGTLAVVRHASLQGSLNFRKTISRLIESGFRISPRLQSEILARYEQESQEKSH
jgi:hypothetical protein